MPEKKIRVLCVDDHAFIRDGIAYILQKQQDMEMVGEAEDGIQAVALFRQLRPDITLLDLKMPEKNGIEALNEIKVVNSNAKIIVLTTYAGDVQAARALKAGANGYLLKNTLRNDLVEVIRSVHSGKRHIPVEIAASLAQNFGNEELSEREMDVLRSVAEGASNSTVGQRLRISEDTVKGHMRSLMAKLGANDRTHAVMIALQRGILEE